jgi:tetratricopeptide (TPR) repeat protein
MAKDSNKFSLSKLKEWIPTWIYEKFGIIGLIAFILFFLIGYTWFNWDKVKILPGISTIIDVFTREPIPSAKDKFMVLVANLENDQNGEYRKGIISALSDVEGIAVEHLDRNLGGTGSGDQATENSREKAREFLRMSGAQIVLWGSYYKGKVRGVSLRMEVSEEVGDGGKGHYVYQDIFLEDKFYKDVLTVLTMTVVAQQAVFIKEKEGRPVANALKLQTDKVHKLLKADQLSPENKKKVQESLAIALKTLGEQSGDSNALLEAVTIDQSLLDRMSSTDDPQRWAEMRNNLGVALFTLGYREDGTGRLDEAVQTYQASLAESIHEKAPLVWVKIHNNLGVALRVLGERKSDKELLAQAVQAFQEALKEKALEKGSLHWAKIQNNLGNALRDLGERESGQERLFEAMKVYLEALEALSPNKVPLDWAATQNNLGDLHQVIGMRTGSANEISEALKRHLDAWDIYSEAGHYHARTVFTGIQQDLHDWAALSHTGESVPPGYKDKLASVHAWAMEKNLGFPEYRP